MPLTAVSGPHRTSGAISAPLRLAGAVPVQANDEWRRYQSKGSIALLQPKPDDNQKVAPPVKIAS